jgi:hypothetical protein
MVPWQMEGIEEEVSGQRTYFSKRSVRTSWMMTLWDYRQLPPHHTQSSQLTSSKIILTKANYKR